MKHIWKKAACTLLAAVCVFSFTACGGSKGADDGKIDEQKQTTLTQSAEGLSDAVVHLSDEEIKSYSESGDEFTEGVMDAWEGSKEELGAFTEFQDAVVEQDGTDYIVTLPGTFEKANAEFIYVFDKTMAPTSLSIDVQYPMAVTLERAALNTLMGLCTVFVILIFLSFIISLFKYFPNPELKKKEAAKAVAPAAPAPVAADTDVTDDTELVAVIAAAIAAAEGTTPDGFVVRSIRKVNRKKW
ncbi:MAG: OadG family transporter subunit [Blautia sp.]|jgi:sodium pump decarboxylase gamma subunit